MSEIKQSLGDKVKFIIGSLNDIDALEKAKANEADRVLLLPYTEWHDYNV